MHSRNDGSGQSREECLSKLNNGHSLAGIIALAVIIKEEEQPVLDNWSAKISADLVEVISGPDGQG